MFFWQRHQSRLALGQRWHSILRDPDIDDTCVTHVLVLPDALLTIWPDGTFARTLLFIDEGYLLGTGSMFDWHLAEDCHYV